MTELEQYRQESDRSDGELVQLFLERMAVTGKVGEYKQRAGIPVLDAGREKQVIAAKTALTDDPARKADVAALYEEIMAISRRQPRKLVREGAAFQRKVLDTAIGQLMPKYSHYLREYQRILLQRNTLLKDIAQFPQLQDTMDVWEENLAKAAASVAFCRARYVERIRPKAAQVYEGISSGRERMDLSYQCGLKDAHLCTREELRAFYREELLHDRKEDIQRGSTRSGPRRDDLEILVNEVPARLYGSQGQQRSSVLALKMAECSMVEETTSEAPIVLLDDVMSELDAGRRDYLLNHLDNWQVFVTCCDDESFRELRNGRSFLIDAGQLQRTEDF